MAKPTLQDIAKQANVSVSTVSLVLSGKGKISKAVQDKVKTAAEELGYIKWAPLYLSGATRSNCVAILFHFDYRLAHTWNIIRKVTLKIQDFLTHQKYITILIPITYEMEDDEIITKVIESRSIAVFSIHFGRESLFSRLEKLTIPVVAIINSQFQSQFHTVCADNFQGSYEAALHLLELGHRNIIYAEFDLPQLPATLSDRFFGFYKALSEHGFELPKDQRLYLDIYDIEDIQKQMERIFEKKEKPTAIFCIDDYLAVRVIVVLRRLGLSVPQDVSVIAPGDVLDYNEPYIPQITTMSINAELLGKISAEMMLNRLEHKPEDIHVLKVKQQLIKRGSCRKIN